MRLENKVALITGAASGMGASMARIFAREGAKVVVADMLDEEGKKVAAEITQANGAAMYQHLDVTSEAEWQAAIAATLAAYAKLDILVNDAGISGSAVEDLFDTGAWERIMGINATGTFLGMDRKSTRLNSSHGYISYGVFCLKKSTRSNPAHPRGRRGRSAGSGRRPPAAC